MTGYVGNIESDTLANENFRKVIFTGAHSQLVVMNLKAGEEIGAEVHPNVDQFFCVEKGIGKAVVNGEEFVLEEDFALVVPAGAEHNVINTGPNELKLYTIYSPANHPEGTVHKTKAEADAAEAAEHAAP